MPDLEQMISVAEKARAHHPHLAFQAAATAANLLPLLRELKGLREANEWRPIESAPRDGRTFIAFHPGDPATAVALQVSWMGLARFNPNYPRGAPYLEYENRINRPRDGVSPTHWHPLPPPPALSTET